MQQVLAPAIAAVGTFTPNSDAYLTPARLAKEGTKTGRKSNDAECHMSPDLGTTASQDSSYSQQWVWSSTALQLTNSQTI